jgi:hypothetical protein
LKNAISPNGRRGRKGWIEEGCTLGRKKVRNGALVQNLKKRSRQKKLIGEQLPFARVAAFA